MLLAFFNFCKIVWLSKNICQVPTTKFDTVFRMKHAWLSCNILCFDFKNHIHGYNVLPCFTPDISKNLLKKQIWKMPWIAFLHLFHGLRVVNPCLSRYWEQSNKYMPMVDKIRTEFKTEVEMNYTANICNNSVSFYVKVVAFMSMLTWIMPTREPCALCSFSLRSITVFVKCKSFRLKLAKSECRKMKTF